MATTDDTPEARPAWNRLVSLLAALVLGLCYADVFRRADLTGPHLFDEDSR
jgi:hypothetical protein